MADPSDDLIERAGLYAKASGVQLKHELGFGKDGRVFSTNMGTAVKVFRQHEMFGRERACYQRLAEAGVDDILGHHVPQLIGSDEGLLVLEISIVQRPFLLDFASAYLDEPPDFSEEVLEQWQQSKQEEFGSFWGQVVIILEVLKQDLGIYLLDVHPGNIAFNPPSD